MKVTLHEVAARAKVSIATVSRTLNGLPVSPESRESVEKAVRELGYVPNQAARALRAERTMTMGLIFSDLRNMLGIELVDALSESIEAAGYSLLISTARGDAGRYDVLMRRFLESRVDALFCIRPAGEGGCLAHYRAADVPIVALFSATGAYAGLPTLRPSFSAPAKALADHLTALGHKRVACLGPTGATPMAAIAEGLRTHGLAVNAVALDDGRSLRDLLADVLAGSDAPTCIVAPDPQARAVLTALAALNLKTPDDVSVVGLTERSTEGFLKRSGIATVTVDPHRMGHAAAEAMLSWLSGTRPPDRTRVQAADFHPRSSTGKAPRD